MLGHVKQYSQSKLRCFVGLDVVHRRIHDEHDHVMVVTRQIDGGKKPAVFRFDAGRFGLRKWLPPRDGLDIYHDLTKHSTLSDVERLKQPPFDTMISSLPIAEASIICGKIISPTIANSLSHVVLIMFLRSLLLRTEGLYRPHQPRTSASRSLPKRPAPKIVIQGRSPTPGLQRLN